MEVAKELRQGATCYGRVGENACVFLGGELSEGLAGEGADVIAGGEYRQSRGGCAVGRAGFQAEVAPVDCGAFERDFQLTAVLDGEARLAERGIECAVGRKCAVGAGAQAGATAVAGRFTGRGGGGQHGLGDNFGKKDV